MKIDLYTNEIPAVFSRFSDLIGDTHWLKIAKRVNDEIRGKKVLANLLKDEHNITLSLASLSDIKKRHGRIPVAMEILKQNYSALGFVAQTLSLIESSTNAEKKKFIGRIRGAFKNPDDMRAMQVELLAATHFLRRGHKISWPENHNCRHDLDVVDIGSCGLQVECKSVSRDKGSKIHRREASEFFNLLYKDAVVATRNLKIGMFLVVTLPGRMPSGYSERKRLVSDLLKQLYLGRSSEHGSEIDFRMGQFDFSEIDGLHKQGVLQNSNKVIDKITATKNRESMIIGNNNGGGAIFVIQSKQEDKYLDSLFSILSHSAKNQVSQEKPALFFVSLCDLEDGVLKEIAEDQEAKPNQLQIHASDFLNQNKLDHVVGVHFVDRGTLIPRVNSDQTHSGTTYGFPKTQSKFWHPDFAGLFSKNLLKTEGS